MKFEIVEKQKSKKCFEISSDKNCLKELKEKKDGFEYFSINSPIFHVSII